MLLTILCISLAFNIIIGIYCCKTLHRLYETTKILDSILTELNIPEIK